MSRRKPPQDDSLELLLDTICNMFGGVIFIAIFMAMLAGKAPATASSDATDAPSRASILAAQVLRMQAILQTTEETVAVARDGAEAVKDSIELIDRQIEEAKARLARLRETQSQIAAKGQDVSQLKGDAATRLAELREESQRLAELVEQENRARRSDARLPVKHRSNLRGFPVVLKGNRLYEVYTISPTGEYRFNAADIEAQDQGERTLVTPVAGGGYVVDSGLSRSTRWNATIAKLDPTKRALDIGLFPDSFETFHRLREAATKAGFSYNVTLFEHDRKVYLLPMSEFPVQ